MIRTTKIFCIDQRRVKIPSGNDPFGTQLARPRFASWATTMVARAGLSVEDLPSDAKIEEHGIWFLRGRWGRVSARLFDGSSHFQEYFLGDCWVFILDSDPAQNSSVERFWRGLNLQTPKIIFKPFHMQPGTNNTYAGFEKEFCGTVMHDLFVSLFQETHSVFQEEQRSPKLHPLFI